MVSIIQKTEVIIALTQNPFKKEINSSEFEILYPINMVIKVNINIWEVIKPA